MQHRAAFAGTGIRYATLVDGSFITTKVDPNDIDLAILVDAGEYNALDSTIRAAIAGLVVPDQTAQLRFKCHAHLTPMYPFGHIRFQTWLNSVTYWTRIFGLDKSGRQKAFLWVP